MNQLEEFKVLGLSDDILTAIAKKGFETPSAIQSLTIPHLLTTDKDIIAQAQTGTGKTAAFGLPIIQMLTSRRNIPQAIVLVPTRELALQVTQELISFNTHDLSIAPIYGGASMTEQLRRLKKGIDIVVGTPGRILDHIRRGTLDLSAPRIGANGLPGINGTSDAAVYGDIAIDARGALDIRGARSIAVNAMQRYDDAPLVSTPAASGIPSAL